MTIDKGEFFKYCGRSTQKNQTDFIGRVPSMRLTLVFHFSEIIIKLNHDFKEESMKLLLLALPLMLVAIGCNKNSGSEFQKEKEEVNKEYNEKVQDANQERSEDLESAREDLKDQQKEEAKDYVEESDAARINRGQQEVEVEESQDQ